MPDSDLKPPPPGAQPIGMKLVMRRSGLTRQTIHFYLRKGLLPKPRRTSRTYALYTPETLELLEIVKECQSRLRMSLDEIVLLFAAADYEPGRIREEVEKRGANGHGSAHPGPETDSARQHITRSELIATLQPAPPHGWVEDLHRRGVVHGRGDKYSPERAAVVRSVWDACHSGFSLEALEKMSRRMDEEAEAELVGFQAMLEKDRTAGRDYSDAIRMMEAIDRLVLRKRREALSAAFFKVFAPTERVVGTNQRRVIPSETFFVKMGLNREIDRLLSLLDRDPSDIRSLHGLSRAYSLRCEWFMLNDVSERILHLDPLDARAIADKTRAMCYLGRLDDAVAMLEQRLRAGPDALLKFRLGQVLVLRAQGGGLNEFLRAVARKKALTAEALRDARDQPSVRRWILLDRALDNLTVADPLRLDQPSVEELEALYLEYQTISEKGLSRLSVIGLAIGRTLAAYALYLLYRRLGMPKAEQIRRKLVQIDPHCILAGQSETSRRRSTSRRALVAAIPSTRTRASLRRAAG